MDMLNLPEIAKHFQTNNISALLYDPRSTGVSDGYPRNELDPFKQVEDLSDALSFLSSQSCVVSSNLGYWGFSFGGNVALCAASLDKRAKLVITINPLTDFDFEENKQEKVLQKCMKDRESILHGNVPFSLPIINDRGENVVGFGHGVNKELYAKHAMVGSRIAPNYVKKITLQTYYKLVMWQPFPLWRFLAPTKVLWICGEQDQISYSRLQKTYFRGLKTNKSIVVVEAAGHEDIFDDEHLQDVLAKQVDFIKERTDESFS